MKIVISSGHGKYVRGASGYLDEVNEARRVVDRVAVLMNDAGDDVTIYHDDVSTSQNENLNRIVDFHNSKSRELDVSVHFNAHQTTSKPMGTEVFYVTQQEQADRVCDAIVAAIDLPNRGAKYSDDLFFLNSTEMPAILIEVCFVDSSADADNYNDQFEDVCVAIAEALSDNRIDNGAVPEPEPEPEPPDVTGENRVDIMGRADGDVSVFINGVLVYGGAKCANTVRMKISVTGDVTVSLNGEYFHKAIPDNQRGIIATVFGGASDYNTSAYDPNKVLNDTDLYVALPDRIEGTRPKVRVYNRASGKSAVADIEDVGPWNTDDPYWVTGERPQAESGTDMDGTKTNKAGIDLSPALAAAIEIDGMGEVDWEFVCPPSGLEV